MDVPAEVYNNNNGAQIRDTHETLERISSDGITSADVILDVGCGSGNVTHLLASRVSHKRIVSLDIDPGMVDFCIKNNTDDSIEFILQDISVPFDDLHETIRKLEGQVDLVWSNRVLHYVLEENRLQAIQNLYRLANPVARCYVNTTLTVDFNGFLPEAQRDENEKLLKIPTQEKQYALWRSYFIDAGFKNIEVKLVQKSWDMGKKYQYISPTICFYKRYLPKDMSETEKDQILEGLKDLYVRSWAQHAGTPIVANLQGVSVYHYSLFQIVCSK